MRHRYFKRQSDLIRYAVRQTIQRQFDDKKTYMEILKVKDFLSWCAMKVRMPR